MNLNKKYSEFQVESVRSQADIRDFVPNIKTHKASQKTKCPFCGGDNFAVVHKGKYNYAKCYDCEKGLDPISAAMQYQGLDYLRALEYVAQQCNIPLVPQEMRRSNAVSAAKETNAKSFAKQQLESSGLDEADVVATIYDDKGAESQSVPFKRGSVDANFNPSTYGDDMLIHYYNLDGRPMTYAVRGGRPKPYVRVRWSNPAAHADKAGKEMKYQTPKGAPSMVYIPQCIRDLYQSETHIDTLFLQEGEKKAEKACKHGIPSVGIQGINNFGSERDGLLAEIQLLAKRCTINNIVLLMDSDWNDLHRNITTGDHADKRPNSFSKAVIKFKSYISSLRNANIDVDIWWGHVNDNPGHDKGVDDLLANSLKGKEDSLAADVQHAMHAHNGKGIFVDIHKISAMTDRKIEDFWLLNDSQAFYDFHKDRLRNVDSFQIRRIRYKVEDGRLVQLNRYSSSIDIWSIEHTGKDGDKESVVFNMIEALEFLKANGFYRLRSMAGDLPVYEYIHIDDGIIELTSPVDIRNYVFDYINGTCVKMPKVREFFAKKLDTILADKKLERMDYKNNDFFNCHPEVQMLYYNNGAVEITSSGILPEKPFCEVWRSSIVPRRFTRVPIFKHIDKGDMGQYEGFGFELTPEGEKCEFLTYLINTSNTFYGHDAQRDLSPEEFSKFAQHLINKITTIGYLLCSYKFSNETKAVIIQDYLMSEVGQSQGGAGKSILGNAIGKVLPQVFIDGKSDVDDKFAYESVRPSTRNIFIDDVRVNFNFERLFAMITGDMTINRKNQQPLILDRRVSPKILVTTNHAINKAEEGATKRRIAYMEFSPWYNPSHTVFADFGHTFFDDWDDDQWNLFDNLMAECLMFYLRSKEFGWGEAGMGAIPPPMGNITARTLRQDMGELFYQWADEYYDPAGIHLNATEKKPDVFAAFLESAGKMGHGITSSNFSRKIQAFCRFKGFDFNPNRPDFAGRTYAEWKPQHPEESFIGDSHKSGGAIYLTVFSPEKQKEKQPF